jgi:hypothetical protein
VIPNLIEGIQLASIGLIGHQPKHKILDLAVLLAVLAIAPKLEPRKILPRFG